jgi:hypothetical protein
LSTDGRYLTFVSDEPFVAGDNANSRDIFVRDLQLGTTTRVGLMPLGTAFPISSLTFQVSDDARYITFTSDNATLVANDTNGRRDVFVYDTQIAQTTRISIDPAGNPFSVNTSLEDISSDGRYVVFRSFTSGGLIDLVYLHDRQTTQTTLVSVDSNGVSQKGYNGAVSDDGRFVTFTSSESTVVPNDTNAKSDVFLLDRQTGQVKRVSVDSFGAQGNNSSYTGVISANGNLIFFFSDATNLVPNDTNNRADLFVHNRLTGQTNRVSIGVNGAQYDGTNLSYTISDDGYTLAFSTNGRAFSTQDLNSLNDVYIRETPNDLLDTPTLIAPADMALVNPPVEFSWNAVNGATDYRLQIATDNQFVNITLDKELTTNTYSLNGLMSGTYYWRVIAYTDTRTSLWSAPRQFTQETDSPALVAPTLTAPANLTNLDYAPEDMTFTWDGINGVTTYQIQVSTNATFATNIRINQLVNGTSYTDPNYAVSFPTTYYWRVQTVIDEVFYGEWSAVNQFTLSNYPPMRLLTPSNNLVTDVAQVDFTWERVGNMGFITQLQVARDENFTDIMETVRIASYSLSLRKYYPVGVYYWRVRQEFSGSLLGLWSEVRQFTILPLPAPTLISPENNTIGDGFVVLNWSAVPNGYSSDRRYEIQVASDTDFNNRIFRGFPASETATFSPDLIGVSPITFNIPYYWRVRAVDGTGTLPGSWSDIRQFSLNPYPAPTLISPEAGATVNTPSITFTWDDNNLGLYDRFQIARDEQFTQVLHTSSLISGGTTTYGLGGTETGGVYYWRVQLRYGDWSEGRQVIIEPPTRILQPANGAYLTDPTVTFNLETVPGTGWTYRINCYRDANFTSWAYGRIGSYPGFINTFPSTPMTYYCYVSVSNSVRSEALTFTIYNETYDEAYTLNEQQLFNMAQPHLTGDMTFALFDITPTGILTTLQFSDGAVVTGNVLFVVQNGLITISIEGVSGGNADQQNAFYQDLSALFMTVLTETLPDDFASVKTFSMTNSGLNITVVRPTELP